MRLHTSFRLPSALFLLFSLSSAAVIDRVAIVIDKKVITESEVLDDLRLTQFLNNQPLDLGPDARRTAAENLVDQELIRRELENSGFRPATADADALLRKFREDRFHSVPEYHAALEKYGVTEDRLKQRLLWQLTAIRFTDQRFRSQPLESASSTADRATSDAAATNVDDQMEAWLKQARGNTKITFKQEAFQ
jgi:hypothetical protein